MASKSIVSHSLPRESERRSFPPSEGSYDDDNDESSDYDEEEAAADLREYGLAPSLPTTATANAIDDDEEILDDSEGFSAALRYLASVRLEAKTVPQTVVADPREKEEKERESTTADHREQATSSPSLAPSTSSSSSAASDAVSLTDPWLQHFLDDFAELRKAVSRAREVEHRDSWRLGAVEGKRKEGERGGGEEAEENRLPRSWRAALGLSREKEEEQEEEEPKGSIPSAGFLASLPQPLIVEALESVAEVVRESIEEELEKEREEKEEGEENDSKEVVIVTPSVALWTFALAANLERPVPPHASAALSALGKAAGAEARRIRRLRRKKGGGGAAATDGETVPSPSPFAASSPCPHAAVVAAICGAYFVQSEELSQASNEGWP